MRSSSEGKAKRMARVTMTFFKLIGDLEDSALEVTPFKFSKKLARDRRPKIDPPRKGKKPEPGCCNVPTERRIEAIQKMTAKPSQNKLLS